MNRPALGLGLALDFARPAPSVGAVIQELLPLIRAAEDAGFRSLWAGQGGGAGPDESHVRAPLLALAAIASSTRLALGSGVLLLPMWSTLALANESSVLDQICDGRLILGVASGRANTWGTHGVEARTVRPLVDEMIVALKALWSGSDGYRGRLISVEGRLGMLPVQSAGPPIWVGGYTSYAARRAAALGDGWYGGSNCTFDVVKLQSRRYRAELVRAGKDPTTARVAINRIAAVAATDEQAWAEAGPYVMPVIRAYGCEPADIALIGSPRTVATTIARYVEAGVTDIQLRVAPGRLPIPQAVETVRLIAEEVAAWLP